jgi:hypothetical protein
MPDKPFQVPDLNTVPITTPGLREKMARVLDMVIQMYPERRNITIHLHQGGGVHVDSEHVAIQMEKNSTISFDISSESFMALPGPKGLEMLEAALKAVLCADATMGKS